MRYGCGRSGSTPPALRIAATSLTSASPSASFGGHVKSGEVHPCHVTFSVVPNETGFMHATVAMLPLCAAARSAKNRAVVAAGTVNRFGAPMGLPPRGWYVTDAFPSDVM